MQEGYQLVEQRRLPEAIEVWWRLWEVARARFTPPVRTLAEAKEVFTGLQYLGNWLQDFDELLDALASRDTRHADRRRQLCAEWIAQFADEKDGEQVNWRRALATSLFALGRPDEALATLRECVERWPRDPWGYIALADAHANVYPKAPGIPRDAEEARPWLRAGLGAVGDDQRARGDLQDRLHEINAQEPPKAGSLL
ncbi:MAG: tetratricopeptide repeat protein [Myxococcales bacterium]|nr:tetratricopeptide repeat protein [Myxococcales bacterium]